MKKLIFLLTNIKLDEYEFVEPTNEITVTQFVYSLDRLEKFKAFADDVFEKFNGH